jgi:hypothetical protein
MSNEMEEAEAKEDREHVDFSRDQIPNNDYGIKLLQLRSAALNFLRQQDGPAVSVLALYQQELDTVVRRMYGITDLKTVLNGVVIPETLKQTFAQPLTQSLQDTSLQLLNIEKSLTTANTKEEMILAFSLNGINNGVELVNLFQNKVDLLKSIINKFPNLHQLNAQEMIELYKYSRAVILNPGKDIIHPFSENKTYCMRAFEVGMSDCEDDYQTALANGFETTAIALFTGGPLAATLTAALTTYSAVKALHTCTDRTIRNYTICNKPQQ